MKLFGCIILITLLTILFCCNTNALTCSEVPFCNELRNRPPANLYIVDIISINIDDFGIITFRLQARVGYDNLEVTIFCLKDDVIRIKIKEFDSTRFELSDVFAGAPSPAGISSVESEPTKMTITTNIGSKVVVRFAPFYLEFYRNDVMELVLDGDRLLVENRHNGSEAFSLGLAFPKAEVFYGLHQHALGLVLENTERDEPYRMFNVDRSGYEINSKESVYGTVPLLYGHGPEFTAGIFLHNAAQQFVDLITNEMYGPEANFMVEAGTLDLFIFLGPTPQEILRQYLLITGVPHMPPIWSLGYHQSRYSYNSQEEVQEVLTNFDFFYFQLDAIWLDVDYTDNLKAFTWNPKTFSDPLEMQRTLAAINRRLVAIIDPHVKVERGYNLYEGALENGLFIRNPDGSIFEGKSLPGTSSYLDFLDVEARLYYGHHFTYEMFPNTTSILAGIWNDMNEPVVYNFPESTMPGDRVHYRNVTHRELHNAYGLLHTRATYDGLLKRDNRTIRPFILTRSHFAGSQRYAAFWTGDSDSTWEYLAITYPICLNANMMGMVFCGGDIGGFLGNPDVELLQRWYQAAAWLPFFRSHSSKETDRREPYVFSDEVQFVLRNAIQLRYKHLPVWYTLFHEHIKYKTPVIRPLFYHYSNDRNVFSIDNQILVGPNIMVRPVTEPGVDSVWMYFPGGGNEFWFSESNAEVYYGNGFNRVPVDNYSIPVFYKSGSIIVRQDIIRSTTADMIFDEYSLYIYVKENTAHGTVYLDDTETFRYQLHLEYNYIHVEYVGGGIMFTTVDSPNPGLFALFLDKVYIHRIEDLPSNGKPGRYTRRTFDTDINGNRLRNFKMNFTRNSSKFIKLH